MTAQEFGQRYVNSQKAAVAMWDNLGSQGDDAFESFLENYQIDRTDQTDADTVRFWKLEFTGEDGFTKVYSRGGKLRLIFEPIIKFFYEVPADAPLPRL